MILKKISIDEIMSTSNVRFGTSGARGLADNMTDEVCYAYTLAFLQEVVFKIDNTKKVILGHDLRPSSPRIARACATAIAQSGGEVVYAGALPTPALALYALQNNAAAIVVTGSHIPFDRNGLKFYRVGGEISKADELAIQKAVIQVPYNFISQNLPNVNLNVEKYYVNRYVDFFGSGKFKGMHIAVYEHSSVARDLLIKILEALGAKVISLGRTNSFVPIDTEAVRQEDVVQASKWATEYKFDAIFSTDGDADRPLIGDELGHWLRGDIVGILCAKFLIADVVVTPISSNSLIEKLGWFESVVRTRIGSPYVIAGMEEEGLHTNRVVVGFEANGGFLLGSDVMQKGRHIDALTTRDAILPMLAILSMAQDQQCKLSNLVASLPGRYTHSDRLENFQSNKTEILINILNQNHIEAAKVMSPTSGNIVSFDMKDGFRVVFTNGDIVHLRSSGNAPELRCYSESDSQGRAKSLCMDCLRNVVTYNN